METRLNRNMAGLAIAFACGAAAAGGTIAMLSSPAQAVTPSQQAGPGPQSHGGPSTFKVVSFEGKSAQQLQNLLTTESAGGWRFAQMSGNLVILTR